MPSYWNQYYTITYYTFQPFSKYSYHLYICNISDKKLGGNVSFWIKKYSCHPFICNILAKHVSFGIKKYSYHLYICYISTRQVSKLCHLELRSTHILYKYVTFRTDTFSELGGNVSFGIKKYPYPLYICNISARQVFKIRRNVSFGIKNYPYYLYICNILDRQIFKISIRQKYVVWN